MNTRHLSYRKWVFIILFAIVQVAIAARPLLKEGWFTSYDGYLHNQRVAAVTYAVRHGDFYPRWSTVAAIGKGSPFLNYYSPGFYLAAGYLHALGLRLVTSVKVVCLAFLVLGWLGMFLWTRNHFSLSGALISATIFTFVPYHFNDLYTRGAMPEFTAVSLLPFLFYGIDIMHTEGRYLHGVAVTAAATASITLMHNLVGFMVAPFAALYICWRAFLSGHPLPALLKAAIGPALGMGLSAFYWLPVLAEMGALYKFKGATLDAYPYYKHFTTVGRLFSAGWEKKGENLQTGYVLLGFAALALAALFKAPKGKRWFGVMTLSLGIMALCLTIPLSSSLYKYFVPLQYVLFPYTYLGVATLFLAALAGYSGSLRLAGRNTFGPPALVALAFVLSVFVSAPQRTVSHKMEMTDDIPNIMGISQTDEFRPKWEKTFVTPIRFSFLYADAGIQVKRANVDGPEIWIQASAATPGNLTITQFYFPGWKLRVDGNDSAISTTPEGFITFGIPAGLHSIKLWFGTTWPRVTGWVISAVTALALILVIALKKTPPGLSENPL